MKAARPLFMVAATLFASSNAVAENHKASPACLYRSDPSIADGPLLCIRAGTYNHDLCTAIEQVATNSSLPPDYFARLLWRESRFRAYALSPKGALGIAQFMPGTATLRGLTDSTDILQALRVSSIYLAALETRFGNLGLAAAAYNAGEQRVTSFQVSGSLPLETRNYVYGLTGHTVEEWKVAVKPLKLPVLDESRSFLDACMALVDTQKSVDPSNISEGVWQPWGAQLAAAASSSIAITLFQRAVGSLPLPLKTEVPIVLKKRYRDFGSRPRYSARIGRSERIDAEKVCLIVRRSGLPCLVFKNF